MLNIMIRYETLVHYLNIGLRHYLPLMYKQGLSTVTRTITDHKL